MADTDRVSKHPPAPFVEDGADSYDERGDSSASKPASNSASKRSRKTSNTRRSSPSKTRPASDTEQPEAPSPPEVKSVPSRQPEDFAVRAGAKDEVSSEPGARKSYQSRRTSQAPPPHSPQKISKEHRPRSPKRQPRESRPPQGPCPCRDCMIASQHGSRPGPNPLQQDHRAHTFPTRPSHGPPLVIRQGPPPPGVIPPGHMPPPGMRPMFPTGGYPTGGRPPQMIPVVDPRFSAMPPPPHPGMYAPSGVSMPPSLPSVGGPSSSTRLPTRPAVHHPERAKTSSSVPKFSSKISTYDTVDASSSPFSPDDDEHFSARTLPTKPQHVPGGFDSDSYSSESPPDSPQYFEQPRRPQTFQRNTTSAVQQIHRSGHTRSRSDYPAESAYGYRRTDSFEPAEYQYPRTEYPEYDDRRSYPGGRRGSNATTWTQHTSASDPQRPSYVHYDHHGGHDGHTYAANQYMDRARGHPEERVTAETLRQLPSGPHSTRSNHSHRRSQHSISETSSRHRGAEGSVKLIMPIAAAEDTRIQLSGDMGDREVTFRAVDDPGMVEVTIGTVGGKEGRYLKSASQTSRAHTRSSGSTRHAARGGAEGQEQAREYREHRDHREHREHRHLSRAPSSRKS